MSEKPINDVLAENLAYFMEQRGLKQQALADKSGMGQTTVGLYLNPSRRKISKSGKVPSAKLSEVEQLSKCLGIEIWQLLRPFDPGQRQAYAQIEMAFKAIQPTSLPQPGPTVVSSSKNPRTANGTTGH
jgi:transcriptional regulator with XRE-family HTH domain